MRNNLREKEGERCLFKATVGKLGTKMGYMGHPTQTIMFKEVRFEDGSLACDHVWYTLGKLVEKQKLQEKDAVSFFARVKSYTKGYVNYREYIDERKIDYRLSHITKIKKL